MSRSKTPPARWSKEDDEFPSDVFSLHRTWTFFQPNSSALLKYPMVHLGTTACRIFENTRRSINFHLKIMLSMMSTHHCNPANNRTHLLTPPARRTGYKWDTHWMGRHEKCVVYCETAFWAASFQYGNNNIAWVTPVHNLLVGQRGRVTPTF